MTSFTNYIKECILDENDIIYTITDTKRCNFKQLLDDLIYRDEMTTQKYIRAQVFALGVFAFHIDFKKDVKPLDLGYQCLNAIKSFRKERKYDLLKRLLKCDFDFHIILSRFLNRVKAIRTMIISKAEFTIDNDEDIRIMSNYEKNYHKRNYKKNIDFIQWLIDNKYYDALSKVSRHSHLFFEFLHPRSAMDVAIKNSKTNPIPFQILYLKGIRFIPHDKDILIDEYDDYVPFRLIENNSIEAFEWYISIRKEKDNYFRTNIQSILPKYIMYNYMFGNSVVFHQVFCKENLSLYKEELIQQCWHPKRLKYCMDFMEYQDIFQ